MFRIAGPCAIENEDTPRRIAEKLVTITDVLKIPFVFAEIISAADGRSKGRSYKLLPGCLPAEYAVRCFQ